MFGALNRLALAAAGKLLDKQTCPKCGARYAPFPDGAPRSWEDPVTCGGCGFTAPFNQALTAGSSGDVNPPGPFDKPPDSKIECKQVSETQLLFHIPATGRSGGILFFGIIWTGFSLVMLAAFFPSLLRDGVKGLAPVLFLLVFVAIGCGMLFAGLCAMFAAHLLYIDPQRVRLRVELFGLATTRDLPTADLVSIRKTEFYKQNDTPVYGIEFAAGMRRLRFGSSLSDAEQNWLCHEARTFAKRFAPKLADPTPPPRGNGRDGLRKLN